MANNGAYRLRIAGYNENFVPGGANVLKLCAERNFSFSSNPKKLFADDFNGDGLTDLMVVFDGGYEIYWNQGTGLNGAMFMSSQKTTGTNIKGNYKISLGDFNGDGLTDILTNEPGSSSWYFRLSNGKGIFTNQLACTLDLTEQYFTDRDNDKFHCEVFDFDCDGRSDVVITKAVYDIKYNYFLGQPYGEPWGEFNKTHTYWMRSTGTGLSQVYHATSNRADDALGSRFIVGDFYGDGRVDLVTYGYNCINGSNSNSDPIWRIFDNSNLTDESGKVTSVTGDYGAATSINYYKLTNPQVYTKGENDAYPAPRYTIPLDVVRQTVKNNGAAGSQTTNYSYEGLKVHLRGRGILGFYKVTATDSNTGIVSSSGVTQWDTVFYVPKITFSSTAVGGRTAQTVNTMTFIEKINKRYFAYPSQTVETDLDSNSVSTTRTYDVMHGYLLNKSSYYGGIMYRFHEYQDYTLVAGTYRPRTVINTQCHPDDDDSPFSRTVKYTYNSTNGLITKKIENYGTSKPLTTDYTYDDWGNLRSQVSTGSGITACTTYYTYDATNRFPERIYTDPASTVMKYSYDLWGNVLTEQDSINSSIINTITHTYDGWGNLTRTQIPGSGEVRYARGWNRDPAKRWFVLEQGNSRPWVKTWYDNQGREVMKESIGPTEINITSCTTYNNKGEVVSRTETEGNLTLSYSYTYDSRGRLTQQTEPGGRVVNYVYGNRTVSLTENGSRTTTMTYDAWGNLKTKTDPVSSLTNLYSSTGGIRQTTAGGVIYTITYNDRGERESLVDPDAGTTTYTYDALGREVQRIDGRGVVFITTYDYLGRVIATSANNNTITRTYGTQGNNAMRLVRESKDGMNIDYKYDIYGRLVSKTHMNNLTIYRYYDDGMLFCITYPRVKKNTYTYDPYGNICNINAMSGHIVWNRESETGRNMTSTVTLQNGTDAYVYGTSLSATGTLNGTTLTKGSSQLCGVSYNFDPLTGNLQSRTKGSVVESFTYDTMDRLKTVAVNSQTTLSMNYQPNGNISSKTGIGNYSYSGDRPHAVDTVDNVDGLIPDHAQTVKYNSWGKVSEINYVIDGDSCQYTITYGPDMQRWYTHFKKNGVVQHYTYYGNGYENCYHQENAYTYAIRTYYINTPDGLSGVHMYDTRTSAYTSYAVEKDHLGSITGLYDSNGTKRLNANYDVWGKRNVTAGSIEFNRGFTGHEHIIGFDLINMNGRVYDPLIGRFLSPDPFIQMPSNIQNYNRYSYCVNNPLKYTDPTGEKWTWKHWLGLALGIGIIPPGTSEAMASTFIGKASISGTIGLIDGGWDEATKRVNNSWDISMGLFQVDEEHGNSFNQFMQVISRHTWQQPMTYFGYDYANFTNNTGRIDVDYFHGATVITDPGMKSAISLGGYIIINPKYGGVNYDNAILLHEYGHFLQQRQWGGIAYISGAILSASSASDFKWRSTSKHNEIWIEQDASARAMAYFGNRLTVLQRKQFDREFPNQQYYDKRFARNWLCLNLLPLYIIDVTWSD